MNDASAIEGGGRLHLADQISGMDISTDIPQADRRRSSGQVEDMQKFARRMDAAARPSSCSIWIMPVRVDSVRLRGVVDLVHQPRGGGGG